MTKKNASKLSLKMPAAPGNTIEIPQRTHLNHPRETLTGILVEIDGDDCHDL